TDRRALWTFDGIIDGSQVSVSGATVYVGTSAHRLVALDARTGLPLWSVRAPTSTAKMAIDGDVAVVGGDGGGRASAIDLRTHRVLWTLDTQAQRVATPVVVDGSAYVAGLLSGGRSGATSRLFSIDVGDGSVRWTFTPPDHVSLAAFAVTAHDVIVGSDTDQGVVYDLDRADGRIRWRSAIGTAVDRPAVVGDTVYVGTGRGGLHALDLVAGQERWEVPVPGYSEGVVVTGGVAFVSSHDAPDGPGSIAAFAVH
ncbi:MAG TPA: PQQ-binding-like beta-propeller repeat protein, partial [Candidatus Nanopelagicales bacterium]|nr:PQQ-binding-like beta-propeller repeat protein [Candidatus Nanopelagicales bacterium]